MTHHTEQLVRTYTFQNIHAHACYNWELHDQCIELPGYDAQVSSASQPRTRSGWKVLQWGRGFAGGGGFPAGMLFLFRPEAQVRAQDPRALPRAAVQPGRGLEDVPREAGRPPSLHISGAGG